MNPRQNSPVPIEAQDSATIPSHFPAHSFGFAFGLYSYSKRAISQNVGTFLVLGFISLLTEIGTNLDRNSNNFNGAHIVIVLGSVVIATIMSGALAHARLEAVDGKKASIGESLSRGWSVAATVFLAQILTTVSLAIAFVLLIIPGIILLPRLALVNYFIVDQNYGAIEAYKASMVATKGNASRIWGIYAAGIAMLLLIFTIIGIPFAIYFYLMYSGSLAIAYRLLTSNVPNIAGSPMAPVQPAPPSPIG
jgi:hypothetical protein